MYFLLTFFFGGESAHTLELLHRWWLKITGPSSIVQGPSQVHRPGSNVAGSC